MSWNKPAKNEQHGVSSNKNRVARKRLSICLLTFLALVACAMIIFIGFNFSQTAPETKDRITVQHKEIKTVTPQKVGNQSTNHVIKELTDWDIRHLSTSETNRLTSAQIAYWKMFHPYPPPDPQQPRPPKAEYKIFESRADNDIAALLSIEPGDVIDGDVTFNQKFVRSFLKSLERPIIVKETDSEHDKTLKRSVIQAKIELKAAYDRGEDICKIMEDSYEDLRSLGHYKEQLEKTALKAVAGSEAKASDVEEVLSAVNKMLEDTGIAPIEPNSVSRLAMRMQYLKGKESNNE